MENISSISTCQTSVRPQQKKSVIDSAKDKVDNMDNSEKITAGLTLLGTLAVAGILIAKGKSKKAGNVLQENGQKTVKTVEELAGEKAQKAIQEIADGGNYQKIKKEATKNLTHDGKKIVKGNIKKARAEKLAVENAEKAISKENNKAIQNASNTITNLGQGIKKQDNKTIEKQINEASSLANKAKEAAIEQAEYAAKNPTHKNIKKTKYMQNQAQETINKAKALEEKGRKAIIENNEKAAIKAKNIEALKSSANYEAGLEKMEENAQKTTQNAVKRQANKLKSKPAYQRALKSLQGKDQAALEKIANSSSDKWEKLAAQDLLVK